jgi:hypothetical protein
MIFCAPGSHACHLEQLKGRWAAQLNRSTPNIIERLGAMQAPSEYPKSRLKR